MTDLERRRLAGERAHANCVRLPRGLGAALGRRGDAGEGRDDGGDLLSVEAAHNTLSVVLRDPGTLRFVKYLSVEAPGSRWDLEMVCELHPDDHPDPDAGDDDSEDE